MLSIMADALPEATSALPAVVTGLLALLDSVESAFTLLFQADGLRHILPGGFLFNAIAGQGIFLTVFWPVALLSALICLVWALPAAWAEGGPRRVGRGPALILGSVAMAAIPFNLVVLLGQKLADSLAPRLPGFGQAGLGTGLIWALIGYPGNWAAAPVPAITAETLVEFGVNNVQLRAAGFMAALMALAFAVAAILLTWRGFRIVRSLLLPVSAPEQAGNRGWRTALVKDMAVFCATALAGGGLLLFAKAMLVTCKATGAVSAIWIISAVTAVALAGLLCLEWRLWKGRKAEATAQTQPGKWLDDSPFLGTWSGGDLAVAMVFAAGLVFCLLTPWMLKYPAAILILALAALALGPVGRAGGRGYQVLLRGVAFAVSPKSFTRQDEDDDGSSPMDEYDVPVTTADQVDKLIRVSQRKTAARKNSARELQRLIPCIAVDSGVIRYPGGGLAAALEFDAPTGNGTLWAEALDWCAASLKEGESVAVTGGAGRALGLVLFDTDRVFLSDRLSRIYAMLQQGGMSCRYVDDAGLARLLLRCQSDPGAVADPADSLFAGTMPRTLRFGSDGVTTDDVTARRLHIAAYPEAGWLRLLAALPEASWVMRLTGARPDGDEDSAMVRVSTYVSVVEPTAEQTRPTGIRCLQDAGFAVDRLYLRQMQGYRGGCISDADPLWREAPVTGAAGLFSVAWGMTSTPNSNETATQGAWDE